MRRGETDVGGTNRAFRTTIWSDIVAARNAADPAAARENLERLIRTYWKPVYAYIRTFWKASVEDAKDLTQAFFTRILEKEFLQSAQQEKGSFRAYLKRALQNFLINAKEHEEVRRPQGPLFSLDAHPEELERLVPLQSDEPPDTVYDREWFNALLDASFADLEAELVASGKKTYFEVFRAYCLSDAADFESPLGEPAESSPTYQELADRFGLKKHDVRNYIAHVRKILREIVQERIREYVATDEDLEQELKRTILG